MILDIPKKGMFFFKNWSTKTSLAELMIMGVDGCSINLPLILIIGKVLEFNFLNIIFF